jgi:hypothetical protein
MTYRRILFLESTCTILGCTSEEFWSIYENDKLAIHVLSDDVLTNVIGTNHERLRVADRRCRLDDLLSGMIIHMHHIPLDSDTSSFLSTLRIKRVKRR